MNSHNVCTIIDAEKTPKTGSEFCVKILWDNFPHKSTKRNRTVGTYFCSFNLGGNRIFNASRCVCKLPLLLTDEKFGINLCTGDSWLDVY